MGTSYNHLSYFERVTIWERVRAGAGVRHIARQLERNPATISRELRRGRWHPTVSYDPCNADYRAHRRGSQGRKGARKLTPAKPLFEHVASQLRAGWSPLQIAGRLRRMDPATRPGTVSHETIYTALYALPRGELRRELLGALRQGRQNRRPRSRGADRRKGFVTDDIKIAERPEDVIGRIVPGHWEGDLIKGAANRSAVSTLVERTSRLVVLARMDALDAETTRCAFERAFDNVPEPLRKSLTYDRGTEMARHSAFTASTGIKVWFCDPYSPWQRPSNENANGLIRQYLPKGTDLSPHSQDELNEIPVLSLSKGLNASTIGLAKSSTLKRQMRSSPDWSQKLQLLTRSVALQLDTALSQLSFDLGSRERPHVVDLNFQITGPGDVNSWAAFNPQPDPPGFWFGQSFGFGAVGDPDLQFQIAVNGVGQAFELASVPEPANWALMIAGFGASGAALRKRRQSVRFALT